MKPVSKEILETTAEKLMFKMSEEQYQTLLSEFEVIQKQMAFIGEIPGVDEAEPMTFPFNVENTFLREDVAKANLTREEALKNAKDVVEGQIRLPKVVG